MTGLYSRDYFFWAVRQHDLHHPDMAMDAILIDINNFHIINERFGTKVGNTIIRRLAAHLRKLSIKRQEEHLLSFNSVYTKTKRRPVSLTRVATALFSGYESVVFVDDIIRCQIKRDHTSCLFSQSNGFLEQLMILHQIALQVEYVITVERIFLDVIGA